MKFKHIVLLVAACALLVMAYRVQKGDTLWDLSEEYLRDPFAWPDLWKVNPHIQDPHWIYPGDSICIPGQGPCMLPGQEQDVAQEDAEIQSFEGTRRGFPNGAQQNVGHESNAEYRTPERPKSFNSYYQRLMPILESIGPKEEKGIRGWHLVYSDEVNKPSNHSLEHEILLGFGRRVFPKLKEGDIAELWTSRKVSVPNSSGTTDAYYLRQLAALAKVTGVGDSLSRAIVVQSFASLSVEQALARPQMPMETIDVKSFKQVKQARAEDMAEVVMFMDRSIIPSLYSYILLDMGKRKKYVPGSAVAFWDMDKRDPTLPPSLLGRGLVVYSDRERSTVLIRDLYKANRRIDIGT
ncbi:MAG: LysM peptidoglycan-binding domain-containing protein, partial [Fibromonadales bacterium]|nr:LysM peptidoglycan-binding domain-containing protein [Fibromonadales bacterium]